MTVIVNYQGKNIQVTISKSAIKQLAKQEAPVLLEMELYFSCLIRKQLRFKEAVTDPESIDVVDNMKLVFRPVMTGKCSVHTDHDDIPLDAFPIKNKLPYVPHWVDVDFRYGKWGGEFGYESHTARKLVPGYT